MPRYLRPWQDRDIGRQRAVQRLDSVQLHPEIQRGWQQRRTRRAERVALGRIHVLLCLADRFLVVHGIGKQTTVAYERRGSAVPDRYDPPDVSLPRTGGERLHQPRIDTLDVQGPISIRSLARIVRASPPVDDTALLVPQRNLGVGLAEVEDNRPARQSASEAAQREDSSRPRRLARSRLIVGEDTGK